MARALAARGSDGGQATLVSVYYDTPDLALARRGVALRVREAGGKFVQTVKTWEGEADLTRGEWEDRIAGARPDPAAAESGEFLAPDIAPRLVPLFRTEVRRHKFILSPTSDTEIEAVIDRGWIHATGRDAGEPVREVEFELKKGNPAALYDAALDLLAVAPLRLAPRSKAARGYRLVAGVADSVTPAHHAAAELDPALSGDDALRRIGTACLDQIQSNEAAVLAGDPEGIHQMRVAVRRLRAILSAFGRLLPSDERKAVSNELRWLADALGPARNLDVFAAMLLAADQANGLTALAEATERRRRAAYGKAAWAVRSRRYTALLLRQRRWFESRAWRDGAATELSEPFAVLAGAILKRRRKQAKKRARRFERQSDKERHQLRIACKKLRYASEMLAPLFPAEAVERFVRPLKRLQDDLGDANDVRTGRAIVRSLARSARANGAIAEVGGSMLDWQQHRIARRAPRVRRHLDRLFEVEPFWETASTR